MKNVIFSLLVVFSFACFVSCKKDQPIPLYKKKLKMEVFIKNLEIPWGMGFLPNGDFLFVQRGGNIDLRKKGAGDYNLIMFRQVKVSEGGLLGLLIDPNFNTNHYVYIYETNTDTTNQLVRLIMNNDALVQDKIILGNIPASYNHDGGGLGFGPDGYIYVGTGDALKPNNAQDKNSLSGKILRMDRDGNSAPGNPFNNYVWTYGHRNIQGFAWNSAGKMISTEHGPTTEFGWCCHDEINLIEPGKNYGWPLAIGGTETDTLTPPIYQTGFETIAPSGCTFIKGAEWGAWENTFMLGALKGEKLIRLEISLPGVFIARHDTLSNILGRLRNVIQGPDGSIYFSSGNVGYPSQQVGDDKIYRLYWE
ncbi:MAG TPA: PQQ-dependent sugar dehydrogenase [Bacteroidia bacterium]|jgi:glucose/arabinose dehydrogenase|nr:PQQ-dependent sugar dehydrogenase [Bacteroidia bacterium]